MVTQLTDYLLYRWRYILGYGVIVLSILGVLTVALLYIPGGLSQAEMDTVVKSSSLTLSLTDFDPASIINLPYHLLQRASIAIVGVTALSIKLPSFILGILSGLGVLLLLRKWFKQNIAVITTILVITTGQFMFIAQSGTPAILYVFWPIWLLVIALMVSRRTGPTTLWKITLFGIAALSLYTPLTIYILLALLSSIVLHPHLRYLVKQLSKVKLLFSLLCAVVLLAPLIYTVVLHPSIGLQLLGVPETWLNILSNIKQLAHLYFDFITPSSGTVMTPIYGLGSMILIGLGFWRLFTTKYTARSYITIAWIVLLIPVMIFNPNYINIAFVPGILLMAMGVNKLLSMWYQLFPRNPYARIAGLLPLAILIGGMVFSGIDRFMYGYLYDPKTAVNFNTDLELVNTQLADQNRGTTQLVVAPIELPFYTVVAKHNNNVAAFSAPPAQANSTIIVSRAANSAYVGVEPWRIVASTTTHDSDRFYIYKTPAN